MSVQIRRRREAAAFLATFVGAQGELLVDTTNNRVQIHDGTTPGGWPAAKLADVAQRTAIADANYLASIADRTIAYAAVTTSRTVTLPPAATYPTGTQLLIVDESGFCSPFITIVVMRTGTDTINGAASASIATAFGFIALTSNGKGAWTLVDFSGATIQQLTNRNAIINGNFAVNQRAYSSTTALAAGAYAHDRWKAGSGGCAYSFSQSVPDTAITITNGSLIQSIDTPNVYATSYWLTWTGTAAARVYQGAAASQASPAYGAGTQIASGGVAVNMMLVSGLALGMIVSIEFGIGTLGLVQFEPALPNAGPTRFERRHGELAVCQRYYLSSYPSGTVAGTANSLFCLSNFFSTATYYGTVASLLFPVSMRVTPSMTYYSPNSGAAGKAYANNQGVDIPVFSSALTVSGFTCSVNGMSTQNGIQVNFTANAEI